MNLVFLGGPGAGKGTQARRLGAERGWPHVSTGDLLREARSSDSELGRSAARYMDAGELVPDEVICGVVAERLRQPDCAAGFILDGFPRTRMQAETLDRTLASLERELDRVMFFEIEEEALVARMTGRLTCSKCGAIYNEAGRMPKHDLVCDACGGAVKKRSDDNEEAVRKRLQVYQRSTVELVAFYEEQGKLVRVPATGAVEEVGARVEAALADS